VNQRGAGETRMIGRWTSIGLAATLLACGGSSTSGSVQGNTLSIADAIYLISPSDGMRLVISDHDQLCGLISSPILPTGTNTFLIGGAFIFDGLPDPPDAGTYAIFDVDGPTVPSGNDAFLSFQKGDDACSPSLRVSATGGSLVLTSVGANTPGGQTKGSLDLTFPGTDTLKGDFTASYCAYLDGSGLPACP